MRLHIDDASARRYFTGPEQDAMERQIAPTATPASEQAERRLVRINSIVGVFSTAYLKPLGKRSRSESRLRPQAPYYLPRRPQLPTLMWAM
jgi:hypothetical protein